jgi:PPOX class probable F420-dependent enzyme
VPIDFAHLPDDVAAFLTERHLGTLTTVRRDGSLHGVAVGFTYDIASATAYVIASDAGQKVVNIEAGSRASVSQVDGPRWLSLEGAATVHRDAHRIQNAVDRYTARYRPPSVNPRRVAIEIHIERILGRA